MSEDAMTLLDHPRINEFRQGLLDEAPPEPFIDWLQEQEATTDDVVTLYAGKPSYWLARTFDEDELMRGVLALWCQTTQPRTFVVNGKLVEANDNRARIYSASNNYGVQVSAYRLPELNSLKSQRHNLRWHDVKHCEFDLDGNDLKSLTTRLAAELLIKKRTLGKVEVGLADAADSTEVRQAFTKARLYQKRCVLNLFPEVMLTLHFSIDLKLISLDGPIAVRYLIGQMQYAGFHVQRNTGGHRDYSITKNFFAKTTLASSPLHWREDKENHCLYVSQTIAAPDWIPPDKSSVEKPPWGQLTPYPE